MVDLEQEDVTEHYEVEDVEATLDALEKKIQGEDMLGATRDQVVEGTFSRIRRELNKLPTTTETNE